MHLQDFHGKCQQRTRTRITREEEEKEEEEKQEEEKKKHEEEGEEEEKRVEGELKFVQRVLASLGLDTISEEVRKL